MAKQKRDAEATKEKIAETAMRLFAKNGYSATTVDLIAKESQINKAMIYYYYENKTGLYETVMSNILSSIHDAILKEEHASSDSWDDLRIFIETYAVFCETHPYFPALMLRELSDSGAHLPERMFASMRQLFLLLSTILQEGEANGTFKKSIPLVIHFMITGTLNLLITTKPLRQKASEHSLDTCNECSMEEIAEYIFLQIKLMLEVPQ